MMLQFKTAIRRKKPSAPTKYLDKSSLLVGKMLDYGCGYGVDADYFGMDKYDPHYFPDKPEGKYDTIICQYVLNVVPKEIIPDITRKIKILLDKGGKAYLTVRRDIVGEYFTYRGMQRRVELDLPILTENSSYCIYTINK